MNKESIKISLILDIFYKYAIYFMFALLIIIYSILTPKFFAFKNIVNVFLQSSTTGIAAIGMTYVLLTAGIDISIGSTIFASATLCGMMMERGTNLFLLVIVSILIGLIIGSINGFTISKFKVPPLIVTLSMLFVVRGVALWISDAKALYLSGSVPKMITETKILSIPITVVIFLLFLIIGDFILRFTTFGRHLYAIGLNPLSARNIGIDVKKNKFIVYVIAGILASFSGFITAIQVGVVTPTLGEGQEFVVISAAVLGGVSLFGGKGNVIPGILVGVLFFICIENGLHLVNADPYLYTIIRGSVIFIAVMIDSIKNKGELR